MLPNDAKLRALYQLTDRVEGPQLDQVLLAIRQRRSQLEEAAFAAERLTQDWQRAVPSEPTWAPVVTRKRFKSVTGANAGTRRCTSCGYRVDAHSAQGLAACPWCANRAQ